jgi:subtilisin family serine protease
VHVAAGNDGPGDFTVGTPATAKNILSVGASENARAALLEYGELTNLRLVSGPAGAAGQTCPIAPAAFGDAVYIGGPAWSGPVVAMSPANGCTAAMNPATLAGAIVLIQRGMCEFGTKALNAQRAGAIAVLVYNNVGTSATLVMAGGADGWEVTIAVAMISQQNGQALLSMLRSGSVVLTFPFDTSGGRETLGDLTGFSSRGPTYDGRLKPDVVCPGGHIRSALSFGGGPTECGAGGVLEMSGTSMATPVCAGSAALVRQYFREGFHVGGARNLSAGLSPAASLIKAAMIHGGRPLHTVAGQDSLPPGMPDNSQGYGLVDLSAVLRFEDSGFNLSVWDREAVAHGESRAWCVAVPPQAGPLLRVSLAWTDPPPAPAAFRVLVNDLDLLVVGPDGGFYYGNGRTQWDETHGPHAAVDSLNNAEQVGVRALGPCGSCQSRWGLFGWIVSSHEAH